MRFGPKCEDGFLPVFSVNTEDEARRLLVLTCSRGADGNYYAPDLMRNQTLDNLGAFSDRLARGYERMSQSQYKPARPLKPFPFETQRQPAKRRVKR